MAVFLESVICLLRVKKLCQGNVVQKEVWFMQITNLTYIAPLEYSTL